MRRSGISINRYLHILVGAILVEYGSQLTALSNSAIDGKASITTDGYMNLFGLASVITAVSSRQGNSELLLMGKGS